MKKFASFRQFPYTCMRIKCQYLLLCFSSQKGIKKKIFFFKFKKKKWRSTRRFARRHLLLNTVLGHREFVWNRQNLLRFLMSAFLFSVCLVFWFSFARRRISTRSSLPDVGFFFLSTSLTRLGHKQAHCSFSRGRLHWQNTAPIPIWSTSKD